MDTEEPEEWEFRNVDTGRAKKIKAPDLEIAWKELGGTTAIPSTHGENGSF